MFEQFFKSAKSRLDPQRGSCGTTARFGKKVNLDIGYFVLGDQLVSFIDGRYMKRLGSDLPTAYVARVGKSSTDYSLGKIDSPLHKIDRQQFFDGIFSSDNSPAPSRLRHPFSYRTRLNDWRFRTARPVFYELRDGSTQVYNRLMKAGKSLAESPGKYFDITETYLDTLDVRKRNAGAARLLDRNYLQLSNSSPYQDRFNFSPLAFHELARHMYFLPDAVVVTDGFRYVSFQYPDILLKTEDAQFVTAEVPYGVQPIGYTWQYVNKSGGPDRRFNNNFEIPIIQITELDFHFSNGLEIHTAFTDKWAVNNFATALTELGVSR